MKGFKRIDLFVNTALLTVFLVACTFRPGTLFTAYMVIGGWQVISMIVHGWNGWFMQKDGTRRIFHTMVIIIGLSVVLATWMPVFGLIFIILLIGSPVLAIIYTLLCYEECSQMNERPLSQLK